MNDRPLDIKCFEALALTSVFVGLVHGLAIGVEGILAPIFSALISATLTLLVSRGRKNWARWTLLALVVIGVVGILAGSFFGVTQEAISMVNPVLTAVTWLLQIVALALLFTPQSSNWLRFERAKA
jgi:hypothetical protein